MTSRCDLKVVLFCKGRGADAASYRPNRDESQWWSRRDALVRCVSSFLFGPSPVLGDKELIFLFDDDGARMEMSVSTTTDATTPSTRSIPSQRNGWDVIPTEQTILSLWKQAAQNLNETICINGMKCCIDFDPSEVPQNNNSNNNNKTAIPTGLDSKRDILSFLQKKCSIEFLRSKGLNSNPDVILRKINKKQLLQAWSAWVASKKQNDKGEGGSIAGRTTESVFEKILADSKCNGKEHDTQLVAGTLHENCSEFPCFDIHSATHPAISTGKDMKLCLFLGAVRDMTSTENSMLETVCNRLNVPLVGIRFGTVPEFTSKILSVLSFHHAENMINIPIQLLLNDASSDSKIPETKQQSKSALHVVCTVPLQSSSISTDLKNRDRLHWCLVRIVVCTLWRSRLVSSSDRQTLHTNSLHLVFDDGVVIHLYEDKFVANLANQHQAAPSEYQILAAIQQEIQSAQKPEEDGWKKKKLAEGVLRTIIKGSPSPELFVINVGIDSSHEAKQKFYSNPSSSSCQNNTAVVIIDVCPKMTKDRAKTLRKMPRAFLSACEKLKINLQHQSLLSRPCQDFEASTITMLQHFCYQKRLFLSTENQPISKESKRKHDNIS